MTQNINDQIRQFGFEQIRREEIIVRFTKDADVKIQYEFMNQNINIPVITVPIEMPMYRLENGRTLSLQEEYVVMHNLDEDFFRRDLNSIEAQMVQHQILLNLVKNSRLEDYFLDTDNKQRQELICTRDGFVVNGNRRLSFWRSLYYSDKDKYKHFEYIKIAVLPECDAKAIEELESSLQIAPDIKDDYSWHTEALMIKKHRDTYHESREEIAKFFRKKNANEIDELIDMIDYADKYLHSLGLDKQYSKVTDKEYAFNQIVKNRKYITNPIQSLAFESIVFAILNSPGEGRIYGKIPEVRKNIGSIITNLIEEYVVEQDPLSQNEEIDESYGLLTSGASEVNQDKKILDMTNLISRPENSPRAVEIVEDVIETSKNLEKENKSRDYVLKQVRSANSYLQSVLLADLSNRDINTIGISEQIQSIETALKRIKDWLGTREN